MTRQWATFNPGKIVPTQVTRAIDEFNEDIVEPYAELLESLKLLLQAARLALIAEVDPVLAIIDGVIAIVKALLETLLLDFGFHVLYVPIIRTNKDVPELDFTTEDLDGKQIPLTLANPPTTAGAGGNWGFYTLFANSIRDQGDLNRPEYPDNFAIMSFTVITGAANVGEVLKNLYHLMKLLQQFVLVPFDSNLLPVPQNLQLVTIAPQIFDEEVSAGDDSNNIYAVFRWDRPELLNVADLFIESVQIDITSTSVYLKRDFPFNNADVGTTLENLEETRLDEAFIETRVAIGDLDSTRDYYCAVGYNVDVTIFSEDEEEEPVVIPLEHYDVSNQIRINLNERRSPSSNLGTSTPPDWVSATAPLNIIPGVEDAVRTLLSLLELLRDQIAGPLEEIEEFIEDIEEFADFWLRRLQEISQTLEALSAALKALRVGFSIYGFFADEGGSDLLISEMNQAFFDEATKNIPPFTGGGDVVSGMVFVAAAPGPATLSPLLTLYRLLFGDIFRKVEGSAVVESPEDPETGIAGESSVIDLSEAIDTIMRVTDEVERSTEELIEATGLVPEGETSDVEVNQVEVDQPCK